MNNRNGSDMTGSGLDSRIDSIKESVKGLVDQGHEKVDQIKSKVVDAKTQVVSRGNVYADRATDFIRTNPLKAVGIAFAAGYVGMRLFRR